jgi:hypothetical protein
VARRIATSVENNFKGGLITEITGLNFPENACTETFDCVHDEKGRTTRRPGFEFEENYETVELPEDTGVVSGFTWNNVTGSGAVSLRVQQIGSTLYFYNITSDASLSDSVIADTVNLQTYASGPDVDTSLNECQFAAGNGYLIVTHPQAEPLYVVYDVETEVITETVIDMQIRDLAGVDDALGIEDRPTATVGSLTAEHKYNLFNQGWYFDSNAALTAWDTAESTMPSNADVWWQFKNASDAFDATTIPNVFSAGTPAPKGHYLLNLFEQDRSTVSGIATLDVVDTGDARFSTCAFMGGRVFYAGLAAAGFSSTVYFTQIIEDVSQLGTLHQKYDPTSETISDLIPSDGGTIPIFGLESVVRLVSLVNVLLVFATNGIWAITGSEGLGFTANDFTITKISSIGSVSAPSFVDVDGFPYWWNLDGIYKLVPGGNEGRQNATTAQTGGFEVVSLTNFTIRSFYNEIPMGSKARARGAYNPLDKIVRWLYRDTDSTGPTDDYNFDRLLNYNLLTEAFYPWRIPEHDVQIHDVFLTRGEGGIQAREEVLESHEGQDDFEFTIWDEDGDPVTVFALDRFVIEPRFKFLCSYPNADNPSNREYTFAEARNGGSDNWLDWVGYDGGTVYDSTFTSGYKIHGETIRYFQSNYAFVFLDQEEGASALMRGLWEWTTDASTKRWSTPQQVYNEARTNRAVNYRRLKVRGKGKALQLKFNSVSGRPFTLIGWSIFETSNASI